MNCGECEWLSLIHISAIFQLHFAHQRTYRLFKGQIVELTRAQTTQQPTNRVVNPQRELDVYKRQGEESRQHFDTLRTILDNAGITYQINPRLVRGLDYYRCV